MSIVRCPRCQDEVTLPTHVSSDVMVECPWCRETYSMREVVDRVPPMLRIVAPMVAVASSAAETGDELTLAPVTPARPLIVEGPMGTRRPVGRARRPAAGKSVPWEAAKIILGGIIGLGIGQLMLWWMPGRWHPSQRDPLGLAAPVSRWLPFIVPEQLRPLARLDGEELHRSNQGKSTHSVDSSPRKLPPTEQRRTIDKASRLNSAEDASADRFPSLPDENRRLNLPEPTPSARSTQGQPPTQTTNGAGPSPRSAHTAPIENNQSEPKSSRSVPAPVKASDRRSSSSPDARRGQAENTTSAQPSSVPMVTPDQLMTTLAAAQFTWQQSDEETRSADALPSLLLLARDVAFLDMNHPDALDAMVAVQNWIRAIAPDENAARRLAEWAHQPMELRADLYGEIRFGTIEPPRVKGAVTEVLLHDALSQRDVLAVVRGSSAVDLMNKPVLVFGAHCNDGRHVGPDYEPAAESVLLIGLIWSPSPAGQ